MNIRQELYERIAHIGETVKGKVHIEDVTDHTSYYEQSRLRVYHSDGYCFDSSYNCDEGGIYHGFYSEYEGFKPCDPETALQLIKDFDNGLL